MGDKRTKGVFALYLERITARAGLASAQRMNRLDDGSSMPRMAITVRGTVARTATVHVWNRAVSRNVRSLCWPGLQGNGPASKSRHGVPRARRTVIRMDCASIHRPRALLTLICSSFATSRLGRCVLQRPFLFLIDSTESFLASYNFVGIFLPSSYINNVLAVVCSYNDARSELRAG
jgi:hypothetical protein